MLSFSQGVSPDAEVCWHHYFLTIELAVDEVVDSVECQIGSGKQRQALEDK
jgi:hypothetical protein